MGIHKTEPIYGIDHICFTSGKTPEKLLMIMAGCQIGYGWQPYCGTPPTGCRVITRYNSTRWSCNEDTGNPWRLFLEPDLTRISAASSGGFSCFMTANMPPCTWEGPNALSEFWFKDGFAAIVNPWDGAMSNSIAAAAAAAGIEWKKGVFYEPVLTGDGRLYHRFAEQLNGTCVYIKLNT